MTFVYFIGSCSFSLLGKKKVYILTGMIYINYFPNCFPPILVALTFCVSIISFISYNEKTSTENDSKKT